MGNISAFAVKRWQFTLVVFAMLMALGVSSLVAVPKSEDPTFPLPLFVVVAVLPGASPLDVEQLVVEPIEERVRELDRLDRVESEIRDGLAIVRVEFESGVDVARKEDEVRREINTLRPTLPTELMRLDVEAANASDVNILEVGLVSTSASFATLDRLAEALEEQLEAVDGIGGATVAGVPTQEVRVELDSSRLRALGVSPLEVLSAVAAGSRTVPPGNLDAGQRRFTVQARGDYDSLDEIRATVVRTVGHGIVRVRDVADVIRGDAAPVHIVRVNGQRGVVVAAHQRDGENILRVRERAEVVLQRFAASLPSEVALVRTFDQSHNVEHRLSGFARDFVLAILLVLLTLLPLGVRASVVVMISIPLSLAMGLTLLYGAGYGINQLSIVGFVIALGLLVDDSVVVIENIARFLRLGHSPEEAAIRATKQITLSVLGCTATLILAFVPLLALPGTAGEFIRSLPLAVVLTVAASLLVSLTIVPFLASRMLKPESEHGNVVLQFLLRVIEASYRPLLTRAMKYPKSTLLAAFAMFAFSLALVPVVGFSLFPKAGSPQFLVRVQAADGANLNETDQAVRAVEAVLASHAEVEWQVANVGRGNPLMYYNIQIQNEEPQRGEVFASLGTFDPDTSPGVLDAIRAQLARIPGARIRLIEFENGPPLDAPIAIRLAGTDTLALANAAEQIEEAMRQTPGTRDVNNPALEQRTELTLEVDEERAAALGVVGGEIDRALRLALAGVEVGQYRGVEESDARTIRVVLRPSASAAKSVTAEPSSIGHLDDIVVPSATGEGVPLSSIAHMVLNSAPTTIRHYDGARTVSVTAFAATGSNVDRVTDDLLGRINQLRLPEGVRLTVAGEVESRARSFGGLGNAIIIAAFGILAILVLEFRTFRGTLIVASVIPLGFVGGVLALLATGNTLSFTATIGFIALMGIEVKNSILLVDFTNQLREEGMGLDEAIRHAGETRFVPILLTTLTAIGGLIPLAVERSPLYSPLAWVILGGLVSSTLLARVVTPVMYKLLPPALERRAPESGVEFLR